MAQINVASAVSRTIQPNATVTSATNASPIVIGTSAPHGLLTNDITQLYGSVGNSAANGQWIISRIDATHFSLNNSYGNGAWVSGGDVQHVGFATSATLVDNTIFPAGFP